MSTDTNPIIDKIAKLLRLAERAGTPAEAENAFAQASKLMAKHGIERHDIDTSKGEKPKKPEFTQGGETKFRKQEPIGAIYVRSLIRHCFCVEVLRVRTYEKNPKKPEEGYVAGFKYQFIGTREDCQLAGTAFEFLLTTFWRLYAEWCKKTYAVEQPIYKSTLYNSFMEGARIGFCRAWDAAQKATIKEANAQSYAIVLVDKDKALKQFVDDMPNIKRKANRNQEGNWRAMDAGIEAGKTIKLHHHLG